MALVTHLVLFKQLGENSTTPRDPVAPWRGQVSLTETVGCCLSSDDDRIVSKDLYEVRAVDLPAWMSPEEWCSKTVEWKYTWGLGVSMEWSESWQRGLASLSTDRRYWAAKLLATKNFRSEFRRSLRDQIVAWLETPANERRFGSPLSPKQWACLERNHWEAKRIEERLYWDRSAAGRPVSNEAACSALATEATAA